MQVQSFSTAYRPNYASQASAVKAGGGDVAPAQPTAPAQQPYDSNLQAMNQLLGNEEDLGRLNKWGLANPGMLRFAAGGSFRRSIASFLTGIPTDKLITYGQMADMMRVQGMRPDWAHLFVLSGVKSPGELSRFGSNGIAGQIQLGIVFAALAAKAIEIGASEGRVYQVPSYGQLQQLAAASTGLGSTIQVPAPVEQQPQPTR